MIYFLCYVLCLNVVCGNLSTALVRHRQLQDQGITRYQVKTESLGVQGQVKIETETNQILFWAKAFNFN